MDFSWFLTVPGILISGGVLLLVIALIILIATSNKKTKVVGEVGQQSIEGAKQMVNENNQFATNVDAIANGGMNANGVIPQENVINPVEVNTVEQAVSTVDANANMGTPEMVQVEEIPVETENSIPTVDVNSQTAAIETPVDIATPVVEEQVPVVEATPVQEVIEEPVVATVEQTAPVVDAVVPTIEPEMPVVEVQPVVENQTEVVENTEPVADVPVMEVPQEVVPTVEVSQEVATEPQIYGGANPVTDINIEQNNDNHQIYGGADPLENTQIVPTVQVQETVAPQEPVVTPTAEVVEQPVVPEISPIDQNQPMV